MSVITLMTTDYQALACDTAMVAFGPLFSLDEDVDAFLEWLPQDPRRYSQTELCNMATEWRSKENEIRRVAASAI